ncbi:MAG: hypothetical protein NTU94_16510 [Planctomycetota bacterium]|nr:hypothetical protein [Planctomycetota bacterium]
MTKDQHRAKGWGCVAEAGCTLLKIVLVVALLPVLLVLMAWVGLARPLGERWTAWRFCRKHEGRYYLVWTSRHGWHEFVANNIIPYLPGDMVVVRTGMGAAPLPVDLALALKRSDIWLPRPFVVRVFRDRLVALPLNARLLEMKRYAKKAPQAQQKALRIIMEAAEDI